MRKRDKVFVVVTVLILLFTCTGVLTAQSLILGIKFGAGAGSRGLEMEWAPLSKVSLYGGGSLRHGILTAFLGTRLYHREEGNRLFVSPFLGGAADTTMKAGGLSLGVTGGWEWNFHSRLRCLFEGGMLFGFDGSRIPSFGVSIGYRFF